MEDAYSTQMQALVQTANDQLHAVIFHASAFLNCTAALTTMPEVDPVNALETSLSLPAADAPEIIRFSRAFAPPGAAADAEEEASQAALQGVGAEAVAHRDALRAANAALDTSLHAIDRLAAAGTAADAAAAQGGAETAAVARPAGLSDAEYIAHLAKLKNEKLQRIRAGNAALTRGLARCTALRAQVAAALAVPQPPPAPTPAVAPAPAPAPVLAPGTGTGAVSAAVPQ